MYQNKLVVAIKHNGKVLRENGDIVKLPFGSEYSVLVKNLDSRRVKFRLRIDGDDALGDDIVVNANSETEIKRFMRNGNMKEGNAFKFIERTEKIENGPRGIKAEDGIISVEYWFEKRAHEYTYTTNYYKDIFVKETTWPTWHQTWTTGPYYSTTGSIASKSGDISGVKLGAARGLGDAVVQSAVASASATIAGDAIAMNAATPTADSVFINQAQTANEAGITVAGSKVSQEFVPVYGFNSESQSHVIVLRLFGKVGEVEVKQPVTVKTKQKCTTCGHLNKANAKFCSDCGTALELL